MKNLHLHTCRDEDLCAPFRRGMVGLVPQIHLHATTATTQRRRIAFITISINKVQIYLPKNTTNIRNRRYSFNIFPLYVVGTKVLTIMGDTNRSKLSYTVFFIYKQMYEHGLYIWYTCLLLIRWQKWSSRGTVDMKFVKLKFNTYW